MRAGGGGRDTMLVVVDRVVANIVFMKEPTHIGVVGVQVGSWEGAVGDSETSFDGFEGSCPHSRAIQT